MEFSTYELFLVLSSLRFYSCSLEFEYCCKEVNEIIQKIRVHLDDLDK